MLQHRRPCLLHRYARAQLDRDGDGQLRRAAAGVCAGCCVQLFRTLGLALSFGSVLPCPWIVLTTTGFALQFDEARPAACYVGGNTTGEGLVLQLESAACAPIMASYRSVPVRLASSQELTRGCLPCLVSRDPSIRQDPRDEANGSPLGWVHRLDKWPRPTTDAPYFCPRYTFCPRGNTGLLDRLPPWTQVYMCVCVYLCVCARACV